MFFGLDCWEGKGNKGAGERRDREQREGGKRGGERRKDKYSFLCYVVFI